MNKFWSRLTFRTDRLLERCKLKNGTGFRWTRGAIGLSATDDTDFITDFCGDGDCVPFHYGPVGGCALAHRGEEWIWNVHFARVKGLVHARRRCDDRSLLSHARCTERADVGVWFV